MAIKVQIVGPETVDGKRTFTDVTPPVLYCTDCRYVESRLPRLCCVHPLCRRVTGEVPPCAIERTNEGICGVSGRLWEARPVIVQPPPWWHKVPIIKDLF